ncbi:MAG: HAMP domain-containing histidine kinase [Lachnospiraceae bacterium]|nr:HAMP domain-containing histidine kinase [Lachnospiraceae bacterium]
MKQESKVRTVLRLINNYLVFFLMVAFVITCCMTLFITTLSKSLGVDFTADNITVAAKLTFGNVILLSLIFTIIDAARRRATVEVPVRKILKAAEQIMAGDFSVRISPIGKLGQYNEFDEIINCFNKLAQELGSVETLRTDFIANVSHEMKTPLAVMQNYGTLLQTPGLSEEQRMEYAKGVTDGARRMADMMTNILKLNRLENQQIFPQAEVFDLGEQLCECLLQFENVWEQNNIEIVTDIQDEVKVKGDQELLSLVWNNLLSNAFKFTEPGGWITVSLKEEAGQAVVKIQDTGCGMTPEVGAHIFEKFYQGDTSHSVQGNGLGLALVKRVVDITQGEIGVESTLDKGSTFTVKLRSV